MPAFGAPLVAQLNPRRGERILDLGCGDGVLTAEILATGASVVGACGPVGACCAGAAAGNPASAPVSAQLTLCRGLRRDFFVIGLRSAGY